MHNKEAKTKLKAAYAARLSEWREPLKEPLSARAVSNRKPVYCARIRISIEYLENV